MSHLSTKDLDLFSNKILKDYDSKNPSSIFKDKIKKKANKKIKGNLRFSTSCKSRDWERSGKSGYYIYGVEDNIATR